MSSPSLRKIFVSFFLLGTYAFGGPAMVIYIKDLVVRRHQWIDEASFLEGVALCHSLPGAISLDVAAYVGLHTRGLPGAIAAYTALALPSFTLITVLAAFYVRYSALPLIAATLTGLRIISVAIILHAAASFRKSTAHDYRDSIITIFALVLLFITKSPFLVIVAGILAGLVLFRDGRPPRLLSKTDGSLSGLRYPLLLAIPLCTALLILYLASPALAHLAAVMLKVDLFAFGGGFGVLPFLAHQVVDVNHWIDAKSLLDGIALGQATPGPVIVTAAFVGYLRYGLLGAIICSIAIVTPSFLLVLATAPYLAHLRRSPLFLRAIRGILAAFVGLLTYLAITFSFTIHWPLSAILFGLASLLAIVWRVPLLVVILAGSLISSFLFK